MEDCEMRISRRSLLRAGGGAIIGATVPAAARLWAATDAIEKRVVAGPARVALAGSDYPESAAWCYDGSVPGPEIRLRQGERVRVVLDNRLPQDTTVHWHGVRVPN